MLKAPDVPPLLPSRPPQGQCLGLDIPEIIPDASRCPLVSQSPPLNTQHFFPPAPRRRRTGTLSATSHGCSPERSRGAVLCPPPQFSPHSPALSAQAYERELPPRVLINSAGYKVLTSVEQYLELVSSSLPGEWGLRGDEGRSGVPKVPALLRTPWGHLGRGGVGVGGLQGGRRAP